MYGVISEISEKGAILSFNGGESSTGKLFIPFTDFAIIKEAKLKKGQVPMGWREKEEKPLSAGEDVTLHAGYLGM